MSTDKPTVRDEFQRVAREIGISPRRCPWCLQISYSQRRCETCDAKVPEPWQLAKMQQIPDVFSQQRHNP